MNKKNDIGKAILGTGVASAGLGLMLYGTGKVLSLLFRDVDPDRIDRRAEDETGAIESGDAAEPKEDADEEGNC